MHGGGIGDTLGGWSGGGTWMDHGVFDFADISTSGLDFADVDLVFGLRLSASGGGTGGGGFVFSDLGVGLWYYMVVIEVIHDGRVVAGYGVNFHGPPGGGGAASAGIDVAACANHLGVGGWSITIA